MKYRIVRYLSSDNYAIEQRRFLVWHKIEEFPLLESCQKWIDKKLSQRKQPKMVVIKEFNHENG